MNNLNKLSYFPWPLILTSWLVFCFLNCGTEIEVPSPYTSDKSSDELKLATPELIKRQEVVPASYIVAFKAEPQQRLPLSFVNFEQEHRIYFWQLAQHYYYENQVKDLHIISGINLNAPSFAHHPPQLNSPFKPFEGLRQGPHSALSQIALAVISRVDFISEPAAHQTLSRWLNEGTIWYAEPNYKSDLKGFWADYAKVVEKISSADWLEMVNVTGAYNFLESQSQSTDNRPIIAIMDSGTDIEHPALKNQIWQNDAIGQAGCDDDRYGCNTTTAKRGKLGSGDINPFLTSDYGEKCPETEDQRCLKDCCHGTHVAGIIAASPQESYSGICPICRIMTLKIVSPSPGKSNEGTIFDSSILAALKYVSLFTSGESPVRIVNASIGKFQRSRSVSVLTRALLNTPQTDQGAVIIAAAGNEDTNQRNYPAGLSAAIAVSNVLSDKTKSPSSNYGTWVDVAAPGTNIVSAIPGNQSEQKSGTSMATPVVSGIAGLILALNNHMGLSELRDRIIKTADPSIYELEDNSPYFLKVPGESSPLPLLGSGVVNALNAVQFNKQPIPKQISHDRVTPGCGIIAPPYQNKAYLYYLIIILMSVPCLYCAYQLLNPRSKSIHGRPNIKSNKF